MKMVGSISKYIFLLQKTFIPNLLNEPTVDRIDRNKENNKIDNLRWASHIVQANNKDKTKIIENMRKQWNKWNIRMVSKDEND